MESGKKQELWEKLRRVGKTGGQTTPVALFWRRHETGDSAPPLTGGSGGGDRGGEEEEAYERGDLNENGGTLQFISSRKLAAALWELYHYHGGDTVPPPRLRRLKVNRCHSPPPISPQDLVPESSSNLRRHVAESLARYYRSMETNPLAIPTASPPSYDSSMEIAPHKPAVSPSISIELKGGKTSTELFKVLKRIWRLEEQHAADTSLIKALKKELRCTRSQHQADRKRLDQLMKDKAVRTKKEQVVQSMRGELEKEMKSRQRSCEAKTHLASNMISKQVDKERKLERVAEKTSSINKLGAEIDFLLSTRKL